MKKKRFLPFFLASAALAGCSMASVLRTERGPLNRFIADYEYTDLASYVKDGSALNVKICDEGMVLLKNQNNVLPFKDVRKISVFGKASTDLQYGGGGSGAGSVKDETPVNLQQSLEKVGYELNPSLTAFYEDNNQSGRGRTNGNSGWTGVSEATVGETPLSSYSDTLKASVDEYKDAAIIVLARGGTEGADCKTYDARDSANDPLSTKHYLELSKNETDLLNFVEEKFDKIVILINSGNIFQCDKFETDEKVSAVLWMGTPGAVGAESVGRILSGAVNPSGRTVDTWTRDFREDPSFQNFGDNSQTNIINGQAVPNDTMLRPDGSPVNSSSTARFTDEANKVVAGALNGVKPGSYVSYEEGVYVDYRYYETAYADMEAAQKGSGDAWYDSVKGVIYPFGYGLSYTSFEQKLVSISPQKEATMDQNNKKVELTVRVTNTGAVAGKDVVQVYWKAPYFEGEIEKPYEILAGFGKTKMLAPGESDEVKVEFFLQDIASYDFDDKNHNGFKGYELDGGDYYVSINKNAHEAYEEAHLRIAEGGIRYENDRFTGRKVENRFSGNDFFSSMPLEKDVDFDQMSRTDFDATFPSHPTIEDRKLKEGSRVEEFLTHEFTLADLEVFHNGYVSEGAYKTREDIPANWVQQKTALAKENRPQFETVIGKKLNDPAWDELLNSFTYDELEVYVRDGTSHNPGMDSIGKRQTSDSDGPSQFAIIWWAGAPIVAATWNVELAHKQGEMVGTEAHIGGQGWFGGGRSDKYGWWGPAVNTHRSPFGGRNFEYYAADPFLMGRIAANVVGAATEKGVYCYFKHFAVNDQEKGREGISTFLTEQALREIYLRPFQMVFEEGKSMGVMSSYNRLGNMETAASYPLLTEVLRGEWGFEGAVLSDMTHHGNSSFNHKCYENINNRVLSGCNAQLDNSQYTRDIEAKWNDQYMAPTFKFKDPTDGKTKTALSYSWWYAVRKCAQEVLYVYANSGGPQRELALATDAITLATAENGKVKLDQGKAAELAITVSDDVAVGKTFRNKVISAATIGIDKYTPLPNGLSLNGNKIVGTPTEPGTTTIQVQVVLTFEDGSQSYLAMNFDLIVAGSEVTPPVESSSSEEVISSAPVESESRSAEPTPTSSTSTEERKIVGCGGSIVAIPVIGLAALAAAGVLLLKKKKD